MAFIERGGRKKFRGGVKVTKWPDLRTKGKVLAQSGESSIKFAKNKLKMKLLEGNF